MNSKSRFNIMATVPIAVFYLVQFLAFLYLIRPSREALVQFSPFFGGTVLLVLGVNFFVLQGRRRQAFRDSGEFRDDPARLASYMTETAAVPIKTFVLLLGSLVVSQTVIFFLYWKLLGLPLPEALTFSCLMGAYGVFSGGFVYVSLDQAIMDFLYKQDITTLPLERVPSRQKLKNIGVPLYVMVVTSLVTLFLVLLTIYQAPAEVQGNNTALLRYVLSRTLLPQSLFALVVVYQVVRWARNSGVLYHLVGSRLEDMASKDKNLTRRIHISSVDELALISRHVNEFSDMIAAHLRETGQVYSNLDNNQKALSSSVSDSSAAIEEISSLLEKTIDSVASVDRIVKENRVTGRSLAENVAKTVKQVESQTASVAESSAAVEEMIASVSEVSKRTENVRRNTDDLVASFDEGEERVSKTISSISGVAELSEGLIAVNSLISGIAARTNLLAMNAAIEAAHAGDAGRGFSVVADEIRKLAENTASHTKSSGENLKHILDEIQVSLKAAQSAGVSFKGMKEGVVRINDQTLSIAESMSEHDRANRQVLNQLVQTRELAESLNEIAQSLTEQSRSMIDDLKVLDDESDISLEYGRTMREKNDLVKASLTRLTEVSAATQELNRQTRVLIGSFKV